MPPEAGIKFYNQQEAGTPSAPLESAPPIPQEVVDTLRIIAQRVGGDFGMQVKIGKPGKGSYFDPEKVSITLDPVHVAENPELAQFVAGHEGAHRAVTPGPRELGLSTEETRKLYSQVGFGYMHNAIEDPAVNDWLRNKFPGLGPSVRSVYDKEFANDDAILATPEVEQIAARLGYWPKFSQYGSQIIREWHTGAFSEDLDPAVRKALERTIDQARKSRLTIPEKSARDEVIEKGRERFRLNNEYVWPELKKLVELDLQAEEQRQMLNEMMQGQEKMSDKQQMQDPQRDGDKAGAKEFKKEIEQMQKQLEALDYLPNEIKQEITDAIKKAMEKGQGQPQDSEAGVPLPITELSDDAKRALKETFDSLPRSKQKELRDQAERQLEKFEDELNKKFESKLSEDAPESHSDIRAETDSELNMENERKQRAGQALKMEKRLEEIRREGMSEYDKAYEEVADVVDKLYIRLKRFFMPQSHPHWERGFPSGQRVNMDKVMQAEADPSYLNQIWERKTVPHRLDYRFTLLVDLSGSMRGEKVRETFKALVALTEVLEKIGIKFEVLGFQDVLIEYKKFGEKLTKEVRQKISTARDEPDGKGVHNRGSHNSDGYCLQEASKRLRSNKGKDNFLVVLSDGLPAPDSAHSGEKYELKKVVGEVTADHLIKLIGIGLGQGTKHVSEYYPTGFADMKMKVSEAEKANGEKDFSEALSDLLEDMIRYPAKY